VTPRASARASGDRGGSGADGVGVVLDGMGVIESGGPGMIRDWLRPALR
jgi:hypothetical protein